MNPSLRGLHHSGLVNASREDHVGMLAVDTVDHPSQNANDLVWGLSTRKILTP